MRHYIRHPAGIPIEVSRQTEAAHATHHAYNVGGGGLAFRADRPFEPGTVVNLRITIVRPVFETSARVVWSRASENGAEHGVEFLSQDYALQERMVEQLCRIEDYQKAIQRTEGRVLPIEEAAREWIDKYGPRLPKSAR